MDRTRGLIMLTMALDHALYFWSSGRVNNEGLPLLINGIVTFNPIGSTTLLGLLVMFFSSLCAPGFLFIAGYVLALSVKKREALGAANWDINTYLLKRGLLLIFLQIFIASPAFNLPLFLQSRSFFSVVTTGTFFSLSVLSTIGLGFIALILGRKISPWKLLGISGLLYFISQFFLPAITKVFPFQQSFIKALQTILVLPVPFSSTLLVNNNFPLIPWLLPMALGWLYGHTYVEKHGPSYEANRFAVSGLCSLSLFFILRFLGVGDYLVPDGTLQGFFGLSKYPPSIDFFLLYLGVVFLLCYIFFKVSQTSKLGNILEKFGQSPLFFYNAHLWLYAAIPAITGHFNSLSLLLGVGIWLMGILILYPLSSGYQTWRIYLKTHFFTPKLLPQLEPSYSGKVNNSIIKFEKGR
ncbi:heparan-alpha-glucosaminide N-acetyltransferase domain-containing protein [Desulfosporosinus acidiphilus]|uniref:heparan-alpha-glucosaminide N-acetyltransferase domain-containing protein n=1 Tax=Desulfosporosinus acidiphilus TaxID=885581 RepID=UPI000257A795|nr:heparan-alpha-glucosaminide N-acetyltransferase domain-containing protein [Desulfosporosinus acidiphilus]